MKKATATAALATTEDCDPFRPTACALTAAAAAAPNFSTFKKLSLHIVIKLGDNNSVTTTHYSLIDIIQDYQVKALHTPTFRLSLLSISQLHLAGIRQYFGTETLSLQSSLQRHQ